MRRLVVFTAQIGPRIESVRPPLVVDPGAEYLCFSDRPVACPPYRWVLVEPEDADPRLASRRIKVLAAHPLLAAAGLLLWHDASYQLARDLAWVRERLACQDDLVAFQHARRRPLEREARQLVRYGYLSAEAAAAHVTRYREAGFTTVRSVTCGGLLARRRSARMEAFNRRWWAEVQLWGGRDQTSLDYAAWTSGVVVGHLDGRVKANAYARWRATGEAVPA